jgi:hypothetical protein
MLREVLLMRKGFRYGLLVVALVAVLYGVMQGQLMRNGRHLTAANSQSAVTNHAITQEGAVTAQPVRENGTHSVQGALASTTDANTAPGTAPQAATSRKASTTAHNPNYRAGTQTSQPKTTKAQSTRPQQAQPNTSNESGSAAASGSKQTFIIDVHDGYDRHPAYDKKVTVAIVNGKSLMWYMHQYFTVTTTYGDGFVTSINGIKSLWTNVPVAQRKPVDWFLMVNGVSPPVGAADIQPRAGDTDVWDFHQWNPNTGRG